MKRVNFKKLILVLGIIIVLNLFFNYGIKTFYHSPKRGDFCGREEFVPKPPLLMKQESVADFDSGKYEKQLKAQKECNENYQTARDLYNRNVFVFLIITGIISIIVGFLITQAEAVSLGLSFGGLLSLIIGTIRYWSAMNDYLRFIILSIALAILIWMGIKKIKD
ncbi:MAG TPA: hypothetical protein ENH22_00875 [Candidatus Campbellbacteria bacterium]|nr:hypothetical protein [Candidatus Campbellbacteria bacterium]